MNFAGMFTLLIALAIPSAAHQQRSEKAGIQSGTLVGTVVGSDGTRYWSGFKIDSDGKEYTFVTEYNAKQGINPTITGGKCCEIGTRVKVTYIGNLTRYLLNVTHIDILNAGSGSQFMPPESGVVLVPVPVPANSTRAGATPKPLVTPIPKAPSAKNSIGQSGITSSTLEGTTILKPSELITFSLAPGQEKSFVLQMKEGDFADVQWLAREGLNLSFEIYDSTLKKRFEKPFDDQASMWFVAPIAGDFLLVSKLAKDQNSEITGAQRISVQYTNKFKLPVGTKQKDIRKINGYDIKIMSAPGKEADNRNSIVLIEKSGQLKKIMKSSGFDPQGFSFPYPEYLTKADRAYMSKADIAKEERNISLIKNTADKTGDGIPDVMIQYFSGGAHCCFEMYFINLGETVETVETIEMAHSEGIGIDKNPKGGLLFHTADWNFAYWLTSFATSPAVGVTLEFKNGKLRPNFDLMKAPAPSFAVLKKKAQLQIPQLNLKPYKGQENIDPLDYSPLYKDDASYSDGVFWSEMLDLIYSGNEELAWQFLDMVWPPQKQGKALFIKDFKKQLLESHYWQMILEDSGISIPTTFEPPPVSLDASISIVGTWRDENSLITYRADGTKIARFDNGVTASGTWKLDGDNLTYIFVEVNGKRLTTPQNQHYQILEITKDRYVAKGTDGRVWNGVRVR